MDVGSCATPSFRVRITNLTAGKRWLAGFIKLHPKMCLGQQQSTVLIRAAVFNIVFVYILFDFFSAPQMKTELQQPEYNNIDNQIGATITVY